MLHVLLYSNDDRLIHLVADDLANTLFAFIAFHEMTSLPN
ncbi:hypothetical protein URH17368_0471 [Alicyclobacillus hesperidum URH17-3-68]|nr:hypothetical protein URH17368_0471 [Alicyclobacillus hesperidum URH17-3-68]